MGSLVEREGVLLTRLAAIWLILLIVNTPLPSLAVSPLTYGLVVGSPQTLALTVEAPLSRFIVVQSSVGTVLLYSCASIRALLMNNALRTKPYVFAGAGLLHKMGTDTGGAAGSTDFLWVGGGLRREDAGSQLYVEVGFLAGIDVDNGYEKTRTAGALGIVF